MKFAGDLRCRDSQRGDSLLLVGQKCLCQLLDCVVQMQLIQRYRLAFPGEDLSDPSAEAESDTGSTQTEGQRSQNQETAIPEERLRRKTGSPPPGQLDSGLQSRCNDQATSSPVDAEDDEEDTKRHVLVEYWMAINTDEACLTDFEAKSDRFHLKRKVVVKSNLTKVGPAKKISTVSFKDTKETPVSSASRTNVRLPPIGGSTGTGRSSTVTGSTQAAGNARLTRHSLGSASQSRLQVGTSNGTTSDKTTGIMEARSNAIRTRHSLTSLSQTRLRPAVASDASTVEGRNGDRANMLRSSSRSRISISLPRDGGSKTPNEKRRHVTAMAAEDALPLTSNIARTFLKELNLSDAEADELENSEVCCYRFLLGPVCNGAEIEVTVTYISLACVVNDWIEISLPTRVHSLKRFHPRRRRPTRAKPTSQQSETTSTTGTGEELKFRPAEQSATLSTNSGTSSKMDVELKSPSPSPSSEEGGTSDGKPADRVIKKFRSAVEYGVSASLKAILPGEVTSLLSPSHGEQVSIRTYGSNSHRAAMEYGPEIGTRPLPSDIVLKVQHTRTGRPCATLLEKPQGCGIASAAMLSVAAPNFTGALSAAVAGHTPQRHHCGEYIFMIDQSGSMATVFTQTLLQQAQGRTSGRSRSSPPARSFMDQAKSALLLLLNSLPASCFFNIIGFGSRRLRLFKQSTKYTNETLNAARKHVSTLTNNLGGTDLLRPLTEVLEARPILGERALRCVFVLTDGAVCSADVADMLQLARCHAKHTRIFSLGIGAMAGRKLVRGLARAGNGTSAFVTSSGQDMAEVVVQQLKEALRPPLMAPLVDWGPLRVMHQYPQRENLLPVFPGRPYTVLTLLHANSPVRGNVKLKGVVHNVDMEETLAIRPTQTDLRQRWKLLHQFICSQRLGQMQLEANDRFATAPRLERNRLLQKDNEELAAFSIQYQIHCQATSEKLVSMLSAADTSTTPNIADDLFMDCVRLSPKEDIVSEEKHDLKTTTGTTAAATAGASKQTSSSGQSVRSNPSSSSSSSSSASQASVASSRRDPLQVVLNLQQASGLWNSGVDDVADLLAVTRSLLHKDSKLVQDTQRCISTRSGPGWSANDDVWTSLVVMSYLKTYCSAQRDSLNIILDKCKLAIAAVLQQTPSSAAADTTVPAAGHDEHPKQLSSMLDIVTELLKSAVHEQLEQVKRDRAAEIS
ncbi:uncharacterized protein LOC135831003 [Sycon ciliatum]|uniref:uncharacterized protein LOC135831003 n=1 Tax=Sycon ciliatum TaxID=27933 RepID=UPI0031F65D8F